MYHLPPWKEEKNPRVIQEKSNVVISHELLISVAAKWSQDHPAPVEQYLVLYQ